MATVRLRCSLGCALFAYCAFFARIPHSQGASLDSTEDIARDFVSGYYSYTIANRKCTRDDSVSFLPMAGRAKRYVGDVIPRLADNYNAPVYGSKSSEKDYDSMSRPSKRMEMLGNVAVPVHTIHVGSLGEEENTSQSASTPTTPTTPSTTSKIPEKPMQAKKPIDPLESGKKNVDPTNYKRVLPSNESSTAATETDDYADILSTDNFSKDISNNTLMKYNITQKEEDHHTYYNSTFIVDNKIGMEYWVDMDKEKNVIINEILSKSHRRAATVQLSFDFPFYGHIVRNMTIATGGFLYTGDYIHSWLAATQYIAPLMANFDTSLCLCSHVRYRDNGTAFTVEWDHVQLQDKTDAGEFSFQATLHSTGDIVFVYRDIPILIEKIEDTQHPVKIGLSDAYIIDRTIFFVRRKTIYEYHRVHFKREDIKNWTVIYISANPTCLDLKDCNLCLTSKINFECKWCPIANRCSTGFDRLRQDWQQKQCDISYITNVSRCNLPSPSSQPPATRHHGIQDAHSVKDIGENSTFVTANPLQVGEESKGKYSSTTGMLGIVLSIAVLCGLLMWVLYAYKNPHTPSGQVLIRYRPSQWRLRRGEARYTAATIHM